MANQDVEPYPVHIPEAALDDLRRRIDNARLPEPETTAQGRATLDWSQGAPLQYVAELTKYWHDSYDWRRFEAELNDHGHSRTTIDGLDISFLHVRSARPDAQPLIITHGWPSSIIEPMEVMKALADPERDDLPAYHVVAPSLPGFGFSGIPTATGWGVRRTARAWGELMSRLGYDQFFAAGGDWGGRVTTWLGVAYPERVKGLHTFTPYTSIRESDGDVSPAEARGLADARLFWRFGGGYSLEQSTKPQTLAYGLTDSPVGQLAWIVEKFQGWTDCEGHPENAVTRDRILDTVSLYWLTATGGSSARFYWENFPPERTEQIFVPSAVSVFPSDIERLPRAWVEGRYRNLRYWNEVDKGGHFPMLEVPEIYTNELRSAFTTIAD